MKFLLSTLIAVATLANPAAAQVCPDATLSDLEVIVMIPLTATVDAAELPAFEADVVPITVEVAEDVGLTGRRNLRAQEDRELTQTCQQCLNQWPAHLCIKIGSCRRRLSEAEEATKRNLADISDAERALAPAHEQRQLTTFSETCSDARFDFMHRLVDEIDTTAIPGSEDMIAAMEVHCFVHCTN